MRKKKTLLELSLKVERVRKEREGERGERLENNIIRVV